MDQGTNDFSYRGENEFACRLLHVKISPKRDLICCAGDDGTVYLHRFEKMERIWRLERLDDFANAKVTALEWRPDGRAVAIAYASDEANFMRLMTEEGPVELTDEIGLPAKVKSLSWQGTDYVLPDEHGEDALFDKLPKLGKMNIYERLGRIFDSRLSILTVVMENNQMIAYLYGVVPLLHYTFNVSVLEAHFAPGFDAIYAVIDNEDNSYGAIKLDSDYRLSDNWPSLAKFAHLVTRAESLVAYLRTIVDEQSAKWSSSGYGDWHEHATDLTQLFFWGTHTTELLGFLNPIGDLKAFNEVTGKVFTVCKDIQQLSLVNFAQAAEQLFDIVFKLESIQSYCEVKPRHDRTDFAQVRRYVAQCAIKNVELAHVVNSSIELGGAFFSWIFTMVTLIHGVENFDVASVEATQQQWCGEEEKILAFIDNFIDPNRIKQYFEQAALVAPVDDGASEYHRMLSKFNVQHTYIYDGQAPCGTDLKSLSLKQTLDYARRLITKLCFRAENGGFGAPNNHLTSSLRVSHRFTFGGDKVPGTQYACYFDHSPFTPKLPPLFVFLTIQRNGAVFISREVGENELIEKVHHSHARLVRFDHYEGTQFFALGDDGKRQTLSIMELTQNGFTVVESQTLKDTFDDVVHSAERKTCCLLADSNKRLVVYELVRDEDDVE